MKRALFAVLPMVLLLVAQAAQAAQATPLPATEIAPGVHLHRGVQEDWLPANRGDIANLVFIVGQRCVAVIDTGGSPAVGRAWRERVNASTPLPVCYVITTHAHVDHMLGDAAFIGAGTTFVGSARYAGALAAREAYIVQNLQRDFGVAMRHEDFGTPTQTVSPGQPLTLDLGGRRLRLEAWPTAHTDNDLTVFDEQTQTLVLGDLLFAGHLPVVDGSLRGWLQALDVLRTRHDVKLAVPGHGAPSADWPAALDAQQRYLAALLRDTRAALKAGKTLQQAVDTIPADGASSWLLVDLFHKRNITAAFAEVEWE